MRLVRSLALAAILAAPPALGHEGGVDARGTIREIGPEKVVLRTAQGQDRTFTLAPDTRFRRGTASVRREEVRAGERAVVHGRRVGEKLQATEVRLAPARAPAGPRGGS